MGITHSNAISPPIVMTGAFEVSVDIADAAAADQSAVLVAVNAKLQEAADIVIAAAVREGASASTKTSFVTTVEQQTEAIHEADEA